MTNQIPDELSDHLAKSQGLSIAGFSERFVQVLDRANFPQQARSSRGAEAFGVTPTTFSSWCKNDKAPQTYPKLVEIIKALVKNIPGEHDPDSIAAWCYAGSSVPNPFTELAVDYLLKGEIFNVIDRELQTRHMSLTDEKFFQLSMMLYTTIREKRRHGQYTESVRENPDVRRMVSSLLDLEQLGFSSNLSRAVDLS